jgi:hypothetical protein
MSRLSGLSNTELHNRLDWLQTELAKELLTTDKTHHNDVREDFRPWFEEVELEMAERDEFED